VTSSTPDALWRSAALDVLHPSAIACAGVTRGRLLDRCNLTVPVGMRLLLVGQPDAAASTLMRILAGLSRARRGRIEIAGLSDPTADGWGRRVAYLGPHPGIHRWMTPREALELAARLLELPHVEASRRVERALAWVRIPEAAANRPVGRGGPPLLQRTGLAAALMADPEVLLLDEPLRALEAEERSRLLRLPGRRRTVVLASHYPASEEGLASHVALIRGGRVALMSPIGDLEAVGLSLSMRDILAMAALRAGEEGGSPRQRAPAAAR
jgi:ABC-2 type transport system ATP-binding protein